MFNETNETKSNCPQVKIPVPIFKATDPEAFRFANNAVEISIPYKGQPWCAATDGIILACHPCEAQGFDKPNQFLLPPEVLPTRRVHRYLGIFKMAGKWLTQWSKWGAEPEGKFPKVEKCIPSFDQASTISVGINIHLLRNALKACGGHSQVAMLINANPGGCSNIIGLLPCDIDSRGFAVIMPVAESSGKVTEEGHAKRVERFNERASEFIKVRKEGLAKSPLE